MNTDQLDIYQLINRLEKVEKVDLDERLTYIEKQLKFFTFACQSIDSSFKNGIKISINEQALNIIDPIKEIVNILRAEVLSIRQLRKEMEEQVKRDSVIQTLKFMSKALHELTQHVHSIKEDGLKKDIHLALTVDGYEMVKRKPPKSTQDDQGDQVNGEEATKELLRSLLPREGEILTHRFGLLGEKPKTLEAIGKILKISRERVRLIESKVLRKCRHPCRKLLAENLTHLELRNSILGE